MKDISVFKRGQIWFINDDIVRPGSIQSKSRPFLVISNDICNTYSSIIHVAPITSKSKKYQPTHVHFYNQYGDENIILLEQTTIKSVPHILKSARYMYTVSPEILEKVNESIAIQFGLKESTMSKSTDVIDISNYENAELEVAATIEDEEPTTQVPSQIDKFNARLQKHNEYVSTKKVPEEVPISRTVTGRVRWTPGVKRYFLYESTINSDDYMMDKYQLTSSTYKKRIYLIKKEIEEGLLSESSK